MKKQDLVLKKETQKIDETSTSVVKPIESVIDFLRGEDVDLSDYMEDVAYYPGCIIPEFKWIKTLKSYAFQLPNGETVSEFDAIVVVKPTQPNACWEKSYSETGSGERPDCFSRDGLYPDENVESPFGVSCTPKGCNYAKFGSAKEGDGKFCNNYVHMVMLLDDEKIPAIFQITAGNFDNYSELATSLKTDSKIWPEVVIRVKAKERVNRKGIAYTGVYFEIVSGLMDYYDDKEKLIERLNLLRDMIKAGIKDKETDVIHEDFNPMEHNEGDPPGI